MSLNRRQLLAGTALLGGAVKALRAESPGLYPLTPASVRFAGPVGQARALIRGLMEKHQIPGFSAAVAVNGAVVWSEGLGQADVEQAVPVTPLTSFRLGSVSKVVTAAAVARLVEDGKLDLDAPVQRYVPSFPQKPWPVTTRQLTGHIAGIRHYGQDFDGVLKGAPHFTSVSQALTIFQDDPLLFEPGTSYAYSSYGWNLVSAVVERAGGQEFLSYLKRAVFEPLGLRTMAADHVRAIVPHRTRFYNQDKNGTLLHAPYEDSSYKWAGGGLLGSAEDLVRFGSAHLQPGFLRQETLDQLFTPQRLKSGKETGVGVGWRCGTDPQGRRMLHHGGTITGGRAFLMMFPQSRVVVALLSNLLAGFGEGEAHQIGTLFMG